MNILVDYIDRKGRSSIRPERITLLAFAKHLAIAGQGYSPKPEKLLRTLGMFLRYSQYLQSGPFYNNRFSEPPIWLSDPTEKGQFSYLAGKAIADFLSKRIDRSIFTVNYEAAMRLRKMPLNVRRPDLLAYSQNLSSENPISQNPLPQSPFSQNFMVAIEAKGYSGGPGNMHNHKIQSKTGGIKVNFTVACVSYNLYRNVNCNYHDPYNDDVPYDHEGLKRLSSEYYSGLAEFLDYFEHDKITINGESFYVVDFLSSEQFSVDYLRSFKYYRPQIILPSNIKELAKDGITKDMKPFIFESKNDDNIYIDNDRIGLKIDRW